MYELRRCVLLADDEERILRALQDLLTANGYHVLTARDGREALEVLEENPGVVDLAVLDVMMPEVDGLGALRAIRRDHGALPVILLTARGAEYDQLQGFQEGADDYIPKPFSTSLLLARMEAVLRRAGKEEQECLRCGEIRMLPQQRRVEVEGREVELTRREFALLYCFLRNQGITLSRERLLEQVWGYDFQGDERTVDTHVKNLRGKLGEKGAACLRTVHRVGYKLQEGT